MTLFLIALAFVATYLAGHYRVLPWLSSGALLAFAWVCAWVCGGVWFETPHPCLGCSRRTHLMRVCPGVAAASGVAGDDGYRCLACASRRAR